MADNDELAVDLKFRVSKNLKSAINKAVSETKKLEKQTSKTSSTINKEFRKSAKAVDNFGKSTSRAYKNLQDNVKKFNDLQNGSNKNTNTTISALKKLAAISFSVSTIKQGITLAADYQETLGKLGDVFNNQIVLDKLNNQVDKFTERLGISQSTLNEYYANSGALFKGIGFDLNKSFDASTKAIQTAMDLASFHNIERERALDAVKAAILGEAESLKSATGITVMDTTMTEYAKKMKKTWSKMDLQEKATLRLQYIIESTENQGAKDNLFKTKDSFANLSASVPDVFKNNIILMYTEIVKELTPALSALRNALIQNQDTFTAIGSVIGKTINTGTKFVSWLSGSTYWAGATRRALGMLIGTYGIYKAVVGTAVLITKIQNATMGDESVIATFKSSAAIIKHTLVTTASNVATKTSTALQWAWNAALSANPIGVVVLGLFALGGALVVAYKKSEAFRNMISNVFNKLKEMKDWIVESKLGKVVGGIFSWWKGEDSEKPQKKTDIPKHARGTSFAPGGITLVGEEGPELVEMPRGSKVYNAMQTENIFSQPQIENSSFIGIILQLNTLKNAIGTVGKELTKLFFIEKKINEMNLSQKIVVEKIYKTKEIQSPDTYSEDIPKYARGTTFAKGGITLVGEEGPELIKLPRGTQVFNNEKTNSILNNYYDNDNSKITNIDNNYKTNTTNNNFSNLIKNIYERTFENIKNYSSSILNTENISNNNLIKNIYERTLQKNIQNNFSDVKNNSNTENDYSKIINTLNNSYNNQKSMISEYSKINNVSNLIKKENTLYDNRKNIENKNSTNLLKTMYDYANYVTKNAVNNAYNNLYDSKKFDTDYDYSSYDNRVYETKENNNYVSNSAEDKKYYVSNKTDNNTMNTNSSSKGDINYISIQGDSIQITFENVNTFEDMKEKIEEFMFKSAIKKQQRLEAILGGKK